MYMEKFNITQYIKGIIYPEIFTVVEEYSIKPYTLELTFKNRTSYLPKLCTKWNNFLLNFIDTSLFNYHYLTHGSTDAIYRIIASSKLSTVGIISQSYVGYAESAKLLGKDIIYINSVDDLANIDKDILMIIALPDTISGKWITDNLLYIIEYLNNRNNEVWIDLALIGTMLTTAPSTFYNIQNNNCVQGIIGSSSKTFGLNHVRHGFLFSKKIFYHLRDENTWFCDMLSMTLIDNIFEIPLLTLLPLKYKKNRDDVLLRTNLTGSDCNVLAFNNTTRVCIAAYINNELYGDNADNNYDI
jgi:hypothetical protein